MLQKHLQDVQVDQSHLWFDIISFIWLVSWWSRRIRTNRSGHVKNLPLISSILAERSMILHTLCLIGGVQSVEEDLRDGSAVEHVNWKSLHTLILSHADTYWNVAAGMSKLAPRNQFHSSESDSKNSKQHVSDSLAAEYDLPKSEYVCFFDNSKGTWLFFRSLEWQVAPAHPFMELLSRRSRTQMCSSSMVGN